MILALFRPLGNLLGLARRAKGAYKRHSMSIIRTPPRAAGRVLRLAAAALALVVVALVLLSALGAFDPRPLGPLFRSSYPGLLGLEGGGEFFQWQPSPFAALPARRSLRLTARHISGEMDSGYGLALGDGALTVAVSPLGEVAVWATTAEEKRYLLPWQPWPHVRTGAASNEIWLDIDATTNPARVIAWVNRERLWQGEIAPPSGEVAAWLGSYAGSVAVDFTALAWYGDG